MPRTALLSVYHKEGIVEFARQLVELGWEILASGGTAKTLTGAGIPVTDVASVVGESILGHRVVTLSREIHAGIMARDIPEDRAELERLGIPWIDLVCVDLYPLKDALADPNRTLESVVDKTDVGGPTLLHSAAKGQRLVICDPADRQPVIDAIRERREQEFVEPFCAKAEAVVAEYLLESARFRSNGLYGGLMGTRVLECQYGENAWQAPAALYSLGTDDPLALDQFKLVEGAHPSYNNLCDLDRGLQTLTHIVAGLQINAGRLPRIAVGVKHGNACGVAFGDTSESVLMRMIDGDPQAIFGGIIITSFAIDDALAHTLLHYGMKNGERRLVDVIAASCFSDGAREAMKRKAGKCRVLENKALAMLYSDCLDTHDRFRYVRGGLLTQPNYAFVLPLKDARIEKTAELDVLTTQDLTLAWAVGSTSTSNTITLVKGGMVIGNACGQQSRVDACRLAIRKARNAGHDPRGAVAYSDSYFPFVDGPEVLATAGIGAILTSSGSRRDEEVKAFCKDRGIVLIMIPDAMGRGFYGG